MSNSAPPSRCFEAWRDEQSITFASAEVIEELKTKGAIGADAKLIHRIYADTHEEAMAVHHVKMGWGPYRQLGESADCPNGCGAQYYPDGSAECPNCGKIA